MRIKQDREVEFINTVLILRNVIHPVMTFKYLLLQVRQTIIEAAENQDYRLKTLPDQLNMPFYQVMSCKKASNCI